MMHDTRRTSVHGTFPFVGYLWKRRFSQKRQASERLAGACSALLQEFLQIHLELCLGKDVAWLKTSLLLSQKDRGIVRKEKERVELVSPVSDDGNVATWAARWYNASVYLRFRSHFDFPCVRLSTNECFKDGLEYTTKIDWLIDRLKLNFRVKNMAAKEIACCLKF